MVGVGKVRRDIKKWTGWKIDKVKCEQSKK